MGNAVRMYALQYAGMDSPNGDAIPASAVAEQSRDRVRAWISEIRQRFRAEIPDIAGRAKVASSTIYRWLDDTHPFNPSLTSLRKIAVAYGVPLPDAKAPAADETSGDVETYAANDDQVEPPLKPTPGQTVFRVRSRALELAGYLPGDAILVDPRTPARSGDAVCAQIQNLETGELENRLRVYEAPYLLTRTMDPQSNDRPIYVDNERAKIIGPIVKAMRVRAA